MRRKLRITKSYRIEPARTVDEDAFSNERRSHYIGDVFHESNLESFPACAQGHVIHGPQEIGGYCSECGRLLCTDPGCTISCSICHLTICQKDLGTVNGQPVCKSHGFFRLLFFAFFPDL